MKTGILTLNEGSVFKNASRWSHDPSMMWDSVTKKYYSYGTDIYMPEDGLNDKIGIPVRSSEDLVHFQYEGTVLSKEAIEEGRENGEYPPTVNFWAPYVEYTHGEYRMYYSATKAFGSSESRIWLAVSKHPLGPFENRGIVADTWGTDDTLPNAIDAHIIWDKEKCYLVYGSFFGGIYIKELDAKTGLPLSGNAKELGICGITNAVEDVIVARDILLAKETGVHLHLCHCSTKDSVKMVRIAKKDGVSVSAEVCPHHFAMTEDEIAGDDANYKMNPPLRSAADVEALVDGLADGTMEAISTDHAPHGEEEKKQSIAKAPFGIVGSETAYALSVTHLVKTGKLTPLQLVEKMSTNPCRILSVPGGTLSVGASADITIADMDSEYVIDKNTFLSKGKNTPFDGAKVNGRVYYTIVGGNIVYQYE